jgi:hypothetical protein
MLPNHGFYGNSGFRPHEIRKYYSNLDTIYSRTRNISKENISVETGPAFLSDFKEMMTDFNTHEVNVIANGLKQSIGRHSIVI